MFNTDKPEKPMYAESITCEPETGQGRSWPAKLAWCMTPRELPAKRPAESRKADFEEIYTLYDEAAVRDQASRCIQCPVPTCRTGCPLSNRIPEWIALAAEGRFLEAAVISQSTSNMPEICSRVCPQERLCENACVLESRSEPVCIGAIEKFINEYAFVHGPVEMPCAPPNGRRVAVVGSGPGGLACADELAKLGYEAVVFEALQLPGGLLMNGIPAFKLDKNVVNRRLDVLRERGVRFQTGVKLGREFGLEELRSRFDAVFLAIGAQKPKDIGVPGADLKGVFHAIPFLVQKNVKTPPDDPPIKVEGKRVAVLGGGDSAMDCLRTAIRCGAKEAFCIYRRDLANMPGSRKEYWNALEEGAAFLFLTNPTAIEGGAEGRVERIRCVRMELGAPDAGGRRKPRPIPDSEFTVEADLALAAYGFDPAPFPRDGDLAALELDRWGGVVVDSNQMTNLPGVFAGGDLSRGPSLVVHAIRDGRTAAQAIDRHVAAGRGGSH